MIFMTMREKNALDLILVVFEIGKIRNDQIDAKHGIVGESHAAVHDDRVIAVFKHCDVLADLVQTADKGYPDRHIRRRGASARRAGKIPFFVAHIITGTSYADVGGGTTVRFACISRRRTCGTVTAVFGRGSFRFGLSETVICRILRAAVILACVFSVFLLHK